ncbi:MAG TPA: urea ABC transporter substrate-binding protein [Candidatus Babeliales bacterium]|jgi:urea transport system substrate-binding protein|nr:urea ABC transporter substrate-binding protein [Candidatus Babeliales bacterium]
MIKITKKWYLILSIVVLCGIGVICWKLFTTFIHKKPIKIGILHSLSGYLALSEQPVADAALLAIKEINDAGGVLGRKIEGLLVDGKSDENVFATEAQRLITEEKVAAIFGCWSSPSRIAVKNVVEKYNSLLFYPVQFEGIENSPHIVYTSNTPNQQIIPGVTWCIQHLGKVFFLVGSDPILHAIIRDTVFAYGGKVVGEEFLALGDIHVDQIVDKIISAKPDVILNDIEGEPNTTFFNKLREKGITPEKIPSMSFSVSEPELNAFKADSMTGDYAIWSYFQSIDNRENKIFIKKMQTAYGKKHDIGDAMEAAYSSIYFWKQAVEKAQSTATDLVSAALHNQALDAPQGLIHIAENSLQAWQCVRVGKIRSDKQFTILWSSEKAIKPIPYPPTRTIAEWDKLRLDLSEKEKKK